MLNRILVALILLPAFLLLVLKAPIFVVKLTILLASGICIFEWINLFDLDFKFLILSEFVGLNAMFFLIFKGVGFDLVCYGILALSFLPFLTSYDRRNFFQFFLVFFGVFYVILAFYFFWKILAGSREYLLFFFFLVFASDTGAYFVGKFFGKRPFFPEISPKKTLEGFLGGIVSSVIAGLVLNPFLLKLSVNTAVNLGIMIGIVEAIGDLFESAVKRFAGKKDSGRLLGGHGGLLDRIDGAMFAAPLFFLVLKLLRVVS